MCYLCVGRSDIDNDGILLGNQADAFVKWHFSKILLQGSFNLFRLLMMGRVTRVDFVTSRRVDGLVLREGRTKSIPSLTQCVD